MALCKFCGQEIDWITSQEGKPVPVDPYPVFVLEGAGLDTFLDDMGTTITGKQARPEEECPELLALFVPHQRTCPWAAQSIQRRADGWDAWGNEAPEE